MSIENKTLNIFDMNLICTSKDKMAFNSVLRTFQTIANFLKYIDNRKIENKIKAMARKRISVNADYEYEKENDTQKYKDNKQRHKQYYIDNKEIITYKRSLNKEASNEKNKQYRIDNKDKIIAYELSRKHRIRTKRIVKD